MEHLSSVFDPRNHHLQSYSYDELRVIQAAGYVEVAAAIEQRRAGTRGVQALRDRVVALALRQKSLETRRSERERVGMGLARRAAMLFDEHGSGRGDHLSTRVVDVVPASESSAAPYLDSGHGGLALVDIERRRVYAKSSKWRPSATSTRYVVGRNEVGTFFAHAVPESCGSVYNALQWIWGGHALDILWRQGDIAVIRGSGPKLPSRMPSGHVVLLGPGSIEHATHPTIRLPGHGERVIVGRRAVARVSAETRD